jgi:hypothetical protein
MTDLHSPCRCIAFSFRCGWMYLCGLLRYLMIFALLSPPSFFFFFFHSLPFYVLIYMLCFSSPARPSSHIATLLSAHKPTYVYVFLIPLALHYSSSPIHLYPLYCTTDAMHTFCFICVELGMFCCHKYICHCILL